MENQEFTKRKLVKSFLEIPLKEKKNEKNENLKAKMFILAAVGVFMVMSQPRELSCGRKY